MSRWLLVLACLAATPAAATIERRHAPAAPHDGGVAVPPADGPRRLECWQDGQRVIVEVEPGTPLPMAPSGRTAVVIRPDGTMATVTVLDQSGCVVQPLRRRQK